MREAVEDWLREGLDGTSERTRTLYEGLLGPVLEVTRDVRLALSQLATRYSTRSLQITRNSLERAIRHAEADDLVRPYVILHSGVAGADLGFCCLIGPGGDLRSWLRWLRCVEAERDRLAEQLEYAALFRGRC